MASVTLCMSPDEDEDEDCCWLPPGGLFWLESWLVISLVSLFRRPDMIERIDGEFVGVR